MWLWVLPALCLVPVPTVAQPEFLDQDRTYYVSPTGSDANDCLTDATPCRNPQGAYNKAVQVNFNRRTVTIQIADGSYTQPTGQASVLYISDAWQGGGVLKIRGNPSNPAAVSLSSTAGHVFHCRGGPAPIPAGLMLSGPIILDGVSVSSSVGYEIRTSCRGDIAIGNIIFNGAGPGAPHLGTDWPNAVLRSHGPLIVAGDAAHFLDIDAGWAYILHDVIFTGNRSFGCTIRARNGSYAVLDGTWTVNGSVTAIKACVYENSMVSRQNVTVPGSGVETLTGGIFNPP